MISGLAYYQSLKSIVLILEKEDIHTNVFLLILPK
jgi:hypothetical protein